MKEIMNIQNTDYWFKVLQFLKQNWALIDDAPDGGVTVYFIHNDSGVFDQMSFDSLNEAILALRRNGFRQHDKKADKFFIPPPPLFYKVEHPNGPIYSSGRFWEV